MKYCNATGYCYYCYRMYYKVNDLLQHREAVVSLSGDELVETAVAALVVEHGEGAHVLA
jgi:hypothetical protein